MDRLVVLISTLGLQGLLQICRKLHREFPRHQRHSDGLNERASAASRDDAVWIRDRHMRVEPVANCRAGAARDQNSIP